MASNRYASHLSGCIGIGTGTRRAAARGATSKSKYGGFFFWFARFGHSDTFFVGAALVAGSVRMRDARPRRTQPQRTETRLITMPHNHRRQDQKRKADRQRINLNVCAADGFLCCRCAWYTQRPALSLLAPAQVASNAAAAVNDDGDALLNRKRVGFLFFSLFRYGPLVELAMAVVARFTIILTDEKYEETESVG